MATLPTLPADSRIPMSGVDASWLHMDAPTNRMQIVGVLSTATPIDNDRLVSILSDRLVGRYPRFAHRIVDRDSARPAWVPIANFDIADQLRHETLAAPGDARALEARIDALLPEALPHDRAPWCVHIVDGYQGGTALIVRIHHCVADGMALARVLVDLTDDAPETDVPRLPTPPKARAGLQERLALAIETGRSVVQDTLELATHPDRLMESAQTGARGLSEVAHLLAMPVDPDTALCRPLGTKKTCAWGPPISVAEVKRLGKVRGCTINDVLVATMAGALRRVLLAVDGAAPSIRAVIPIDVRNPRKDLSSELGNAFSLVFLDLPLDEADRLGRLRRVHERMLALKDGVQVGLIYGVLRAAGHAPTKVEELLVDHLGERATLVMTNVPGPRHHRFLAGVRLDDIRFLVPVSGRLGLGVSILSYAGRVTMGVAGDVAVLGDPHRFTRAFSDEYAALKRDLGVR